ncbi:hypothetical protein UFOVP978_23 [uncultured Caudovirales phage]|uniref:Uncharacterized protein n=1 Tax=uncultured Caudovirales phage TaxID=2100421 RepID=A0A6J5PWT0_9CAUD|nr:hypothetical protein UFOVP978_23 [uncultured Caudovirales phage]
MGFRAGSSLSPEYGYSYGDLVPEASEWPYIRQMCRSGALVPETDADIPGRLPKFSVSRRMLAMQEFLKNKEAEEKPVKVETKAKTPKATPAASAGATTEKG